MIKEDNGANSVCFGLSDIGVTRLSGYARLRSNRTRDVGHQL